MYVIYSLTDALYENGPFVRVEGNTSIPLEYKRDEFGNYPFAEHLVSDFSSSPVVKFESREQAELFAASLRGSYLVMDEKQARDEHAVMFVTAAASMINDIHEFAVDDVGGDSGIIDTKYQGALGGDNRVIVVVNSPSERTVYDVIVSVYNENDEWELAPSYVFDHVDTVVNESLTKELHPPTVVAALDSDDDEFDGDDDEEEEEESDIYDSENDLDDDDDEEEEEENEEPVAEEAPTAPALIDLTSEQRDAATRLVEAMNAALAQLQQQFNDSLASLIKK